VRQILMRLHVSGLLAILIVLCVGSGTQAAQIGDMAAGRFYARQICAECHAVNANEKQSPVVRATAFRRIANTSGMTRTALLVFFKTPHLNMPNLIIAGDDADNVIAYILSLQTKH